MNDSLFIASEVKLLCVDDSQANLEILKVVLKDEGYQLAFATSGEDALEIVFDYLPDLILLDVLMPGIEGYDVCRCIKEDPRTKDIPVIFVTGMDQKLQKNLGFAVGCVDYITKPIESLDLATRVKTHLSIKALQKENSALKHRIKELEK